MFSFWSRQKMPITSWLSMSEPLAQVADLVGEADLEGVPGVAGVLDHLGGADAGGHQRRLDLAVQRFGRLRVRLVVVADQRHRRIVEVLDRRALAQELGIDGDAEPYPVLSCPTPFERRNHTPCVVPAAPCCARRRRGRRPCPSASPICSQTRSR